MKIPIFRMSFIIFFMGTVIVSIEASAANLPDSIPIGWWKARNNSPDIIIGTDTVVKHSGRASCFIRREPTPIWGKAVMAQSIAANAYINKRVRLTVYLKSKDVEWAILYIRVDGCIVNGFDTTLTFTSTQSENPVQETMDWTKFDLVLDVPEHSTNIDFGIALEGQGKLWMDDVTLEVVDRSIPSKDFIATAMMKTKRRVENIRRLQNSKPFNLDFEDK